MSGPERGLGRGLGALIPGSGGPGLREIPLASIEPNPQQPRMVIAQPQLEELAESIREHGVLQPVVVSRLPDGGGRYQLVAGERRWRAATLAGLSTIPAVVRETTPRASLEMALVENIQRRDLNPLEEAHAYKQLLEEHGLTQELLAQRLARSRVTVTNTLRLLQLVPEVQRALAEGAITEGHARAILSGGDASAQRAVLEEVVFRGLNVRQTEALARKVAEHEDEEASPPSESARVDPQTAHLEDAFRQALGTRVRLVRGRRGGRLVIHFFSDDELQGLYESIVERSS